MSAAVKLNHPCSQGYGNFRCLMTQAIAVCADADAFPAVPRRLVTQAILC
jgi:hypothetical protein